VFLEGLARRVGLVQGSRTGRFVEVPVVDDRARFVATHCHHRAGHLAKPVGIKDLEPDDESDPLAVAHASTRGERTGQEILARTEGFGGYVLMLPRVRVESFVG
jgi:hypothetical protein